MSLSLLSLFVPVSLTVSFFLSFSLSLSFASCVSLYLPLFLPSPQSCQLCMHIRVVHEYMSTGTAEEAFAPPLHAQM